MIEFNVRIDFFRDLEDGPKGYVGMPPCRPSKPIH
jgi:hypothetical protein